MAPPSSFSNMRKILGPIVRWKIELRPLRDPPSIKRQKMRWHALMSGDDINYSTKPTKPNLTSSKYQRVPKEYASVELLQMTFKRTRYLWVLIICKVTVEPFESIR